VDRQLLEGQAAAEELAQMAVVRAKLLLLLL